MHSLSNIVPDSERAKHKQNRQSRLDALYAVHGQRPATNLRHHLALAELDESAFAAHLDARKRYEEAA